MFNHDRKRMKIILHSFFISLHNVTIKCVYIKTIMHGQGVNANHYQPEHIDLIREIFKLLKRNSAF